MTASKPHSRQDDIATVRYYLNIVAEEDSLAEAHAALSRVIEQLEAAQQTAKDARLGELHAGDHAKELQEQLDASQRAMKGALAAIMVGQPDRPRALHEAERILRAALASNPASSPVGTVKDGTLHWTDSDGVPHSGPFQEREPQ